MSYTLTILNLDSVEVVRQPDKPSLEQLQRYVGGWVELVPGFTLYGSKTCEAYCNEGGRIKRLPLNYDATALWRYDNGATDFLVGSVVIVVKEPMS